MDIATLALIFDTVRSTFTAAQVKLLIGKTEAYAGAEVVGVMDTTTADARASDNGILSGFTATVYVKYTELPTTEYGLRDGDTVEIINATGEANTVRRVNGIQEIGRNTTTGRPIIYGLTLADEHTP